MLQDINWQKSRPLASKYSWHALHGEGTLLPPLPCWLPSCIPSRNSPRYVSCSLLLQTPQTLSRPLNQSTTLHGRRGVQLCVLWDGPCLQWWCWWPLPVHQMCQTPEREARVGCMLYVPLAVFGLVGKSQTGRSSLKSMTATSVQVKSWIIYLNSMSSCMQVMKMCNNLSSPLVILYDEIYLTADVSRQWLLIK